METSHLLLDAVTFLGWLKNNGIRPRGKRWLPPKALSQLNAQLFLRDTIHLPARTNTGGRIGTRELDTHHIRFLHYLCEAAHLVARTGLYLKPTLRVKAWLTTDPFDQLYQLFTAAYPNYPSRPHDELWRTYRLPGWSLTSPTVALLQPLFLLLRAAPSGEQIKLSSLLKLIPLPEDGDELPSDIVRGLLSGLQTFGAIHWHSTAVFSVTTLGLAIIHCRPPVPPLALSLAGQAPLLQIDQRLYPLVLTDAATLYELAVYADLVGVKPARRYRLSRERVQHALRHGHSLDAILRFLENTIGDALPAQLLQQIHDWAAALDRVAMRRVTLLEVKDPATLTDLTRSHRVRESIQRTLSPRAVVIRESRLPALLRQLDRRGLTPRTNLPNCVIASTRGAQQSPTRLFDNSSVAQLYYTTLLNHYLADQLSAPYRIDYSIILELERTISPSDQLLARQLAAEAAEELKVEYRGWNEHSSIDHSDSVFQLSNSSLASTLSHIEAAILADQPLILSYYSPAYAQTTERIVEPLRLEWRGDTPYLIAYCRLRQDERTFRLERILEVRNAEG
jgi:hypothetical protein